MFKKLSLVEISFSETLTIADINLQCPPAMRGSVLFWLSSSSSPQLQFRPYPFQRKTCTQNVLMWCGLSPSIRAHAFKTLLQNVLTASGFFKKWFIGGADSMSLRVIISKEISILTFDITKSFIIYHHLSSFIIIYPLYSYPLILLCPCAYDSIQSSFSHLLLS